MFYGVILWASRPPLVFIHTKALFYGRTPCAPGPKKRLTSMRWPVGIGRRRRRAIVPAEGLPRNRKRTRPRPARSAQPARGIPASCIFPGYSHICLKEGKSLTSRKPGFVRHHRHKHPTSSSDCYRHLLRMPSVPFAPEVFWLPRKLLFIRTPPDPSVPRSRPQGFLRPDRYGARSNPSAGRAAITYAIRDDR